MTERRTRYEKPLPVILDETKAFWEGCRKHELLIQKCSDCGTYRYPPRLMCHKCNSWNSEWVKVSGKGLVYSYMVVHHHSVRGSPPGFEKDVPYAVVLIELLEASKIRMVSNLVGCKLEDIKIGLPVEVVFDDVTQEITLPKFRPIA